MQLTQADVTITTTCVIPDTQLARAVVDVAVERALADWMPTIASRTVPTEYGPIEIAVRRK